MSTIFREILIFTDNKSSHAREIENNFLGNLNCWLKQISSLTLPDPTTVTQKTWVGAIKFSLNYQKYNEISFMDLEKKISREMKICRLIPRLLEQHYITMYWIEVFLLSLLLSVPMNLFYRWAESWFHFK